MPKIPTFTSTRSITAETASVGSNIQLNVNNTPASALAPVSDFIQKSYIKEKQTEANNKSYKAINEFYEDQKDETGNVIQKGWLTISSEAKQKENPTDASNYFDSEIQKLYNYNKTKNYKNLNNFEKKAIDAKFYATTGMLKTTAIQQARLNMIQENKDIDDDTFVKEAQLLSQMGTIYIEQFKNVMTSRIESNPEYDDGTKKILIKEYHTKGVEFLAKSMASSKPLQFKQAMKEDKFTDVSAVKLLEFDGIANENIKKQKFETLLSALDVPFDSDPRDFIVANEEIQNKNFGNNEQLQAIYASLTPQEVVEFKEAYKTKASAIRADRNMNILTAAQVGKVAAAQNTNEIFRDLDKKNGIYNQKLKKLFPDNLLAVEQLTEFSLKVSEGSANQVSNFDKNDDIIKLIINDEINSVYDKFTLPGETESLSVIERAGKQINVADAQYLNTLFEISGEKGFKENHTKFFKFIDMFGLEVAGSSALKSLDTQRDKRLNNFKYAMYNRYITGLQNGHTADELLKPTKGNKKFIGYDFHTYIPNMNDVFKDISISIKKGSEDLPDIPGQKKKTKKELEDELGRTITISEYKELTKGN